MINLFLPIFIVLPLAAAFLAPLLNRIHHRLPAWLSLLTSFFLLAMAIGLYFARPLLGVLIYNSHGAYFILDAFSHLVLLAVNFVACLVILYSSGYLGKAFPRDKYFTLFMLMLTGMNGVLMAGDLFTLFVFLELSAIATYTLVAFDTSAEALEAALKYLFMGTVASLLLLLGLGIIYRLTGTFFMASLPSRLDMLGGSTRAFISALFLLGFGMKAAIVPFHAWLPDAHTSAPAPVSATLSGVLIKALGIYCLVRIAYNILGINASLSLVLMILGILSIFTGGLLAWRQEDLKRLLAYSSISQIGYIVLGFGLATPLGILGAVFHLFNHALLKPLLFLNAGAIEQATGTRQLKKLGGLFKKMPVTAVSSLIASFSICGLPPFNGFWSKLFIILACIKAGRIGFAGLAAVGSILTIAYFFKLQKAVFFDQLPSALEKVKEVSFAMKAPMVLLALACISIGILFPFVVFFLVNPAMLVLAGGKT